MNDLSLFEPTIVDLLGTLLLATHLDVTFVMEHRAGQIPELTVDFAGPDTALLIARNGELLRAVEHLIAKVCQLEPSQHDLLSVDAGSFKEKRDYLLQAAAGRAASQVRETGRPYVFSPMSSHERRRLHLVLNQTGLHTASTGEGAHRAVVLYPRGASS